MTPRCSRFRTLLAMLALAIVAVPLLMQGPAQARSPGAGSGSGWVTLIAGHGLRNPGGIAIDLRGDPTQNKWAYTADASTGRIVKFGTGGNVLKSWRFARPRNAGTQASIAVGGTGNVFVADPGTNSVLKFSPYGGPLARWPSVDGVRGIAVDRGGHVYVAQYRAHRVTELSSSGRVLKRWDTHTLWNGQSAGNPTGVAVVGQHALYISTTCRVGLSCARRVAYLAGGGHWVDVLLLLSPHRLRGDQVGTVGIGHSAGGTPQAPRDACNHRFVTLQSIASAPHGTLYVAGLLWPREDQTPALAVGSGPGAPGCSHDGIGPEWKRWYLPGGTVRGLAVDGQGTVYVAEGDRILKLLPSSTPQPAASPTGTVQAAP